MSWYIAVLRKYATFSGRARRKEYWMFVLLNLIFELIAYILDNLFKITIKDLGYGPIYIAYAVAVLLPAIAVSFRRLHDIGWSGWYLLLALIPIVGPIILLVRYCQAGQPGINKYGPNPKEAVAA